MKDVQATGTNGGTFTSGSWFERTLNTLETFPSASTNIAITGATGAFALATGTYFLCSNAPAYRVDNHQSRLFNITGGTTEDLGSPEFADNATQGDQTRTFINHIFTIGSSTTFSIEHQCTTTRATDGFGLAAGFDREVYTEVSIIKLA
jgi:hypothetical protein